MPVYRGGVPDRPDNTLDSFSGARCTGVVRKLAVWSTSGVMFLDSAGEIETDTYQVLRVLLSEYKARCAVVPSLIYTPP
jgi:hypothetical protein